MEHDDYKDALLEMKYRRASRRRIEIVLRAYILLGLLVAFIAIAYLGLTLLPVDLTTTQQMALATAGIGIALAAMSRFLMILRKERENEEFEELQEYKAISDFLEIWNTFESVSKHVLSESDRDINFHSLRAVVSRLNEEGKISRSDVRALEDALRTRNAIVHGGVPFSPNLVRSITETIIDIIKKLPSTR